MLKLIRTKTWEELNNHLDRLKTEIYTANKKLKFLGAGMIDYEDKCKEYREQLFEKSKELGSLKAENKILNNSLTAAEYCLVRKDSKIEQYSNQIDKIRDFILKYGK